MYLYEKNGDKVEIYLATPKEREIKEYKENFKDNIIGVIAKTNERRPIFQKLIRRTNLIVDVPYDELNHTKDLKTHKLVVNETSLSPKYYINSKSDTFACMPLVRIIDKNQYLLFTLPRTRYKRVDTCLYSDNFYLDNIILIPRKLFLLELLIRERFDLLEGYDISRQIELFKIEKEFIKSINYMNLSYYEKKSEESSKILKLVK